MQSGVSDLITKTQAEKDCSFDKACEKIIKEIEIQAFIHNYLPNIPDWLIGYKRSMTYEYKLTFEIEKRKMYIHIFVLDSKLHDIVLHIYRAEDAVEKQSDVFAIIDYRPEAFVEFWYSLKKHKEEGYFRYIYAYPYVFKPKPKFGDLELNKETKEWIEKIKTFVV